MDALIDGCIDHTAQRLKDPIGFSYVSCMCLAALKYSVG